MLSILSCLKSHSRSHLALCCPDSFVFSHIWWFSSLFSFVMTLTLSTDHIHKVSVWVCLVFSHDWNGLPRCCAQSLLGLIVFMCSSYLPVAKTLSVFGDLAQSSYWTRSRSNEHRNPNLTVLAFIHLNVGKGFVGGGLSLRITGAWSSVTTERVEHKNEQEAVLTECLGWGSVGNGRILFDATERLRRFGEG